MHVQLSLSLHFYLLHNANSCDGNDTKQRVFLGRLLVALKTAGFSYEMFKMMSFTHFAFMLTITCNRFLH